MKTYTCFACDRVFQAKRHRPCPYCGKRFPDQRIDDYVTRIMGSMDNRVKPSLGGKVYNR